MHQPQTKRGIVRKIKKNESGSDPGEDALDQEANGVHVNLISGGNGFLPHMQ